MAEAGDLEQLLKEELAMVLKFRVSDDLLASIEKLDNWPAKVKLMQKIG